MTTPRNGQSVRIRMDELEAEVERLRAALTDALHILDSPRIKPILATRGAAWVQHRQRLRVARAALEAGDAA